MKQKIIQQGAEAKIILVESPIIKTSSRVGGRGSEALEGGAKFIIKDRIKKSYRIPELDKKIRKRRTKSETKLLTKASKIINSPKPFLKPEVSYKIKMPYIQGKKLSEYLDKFPFKKQKEICKQIGQEIAKLHDADIIHGDLTTSNMILLDSKNNNLNPLWENGLGTPNNNEPIIYFIDFGLGYISKKFEDKAVDLHLLKQALEAKHFKNWKELLEEVFKGYKKSKDSKIVLERLKAVEKRGRYKH